MKAPAFIIKKCIQKGTFRNVMEGSNRVGFEVKLKNKIGSGTLVGLSKIRINDNQYPLDMFLAIKNGEEYRAGELGEGRPMTFKFGDELTLKVLDGKGLEPGKYRVGVTVDFVGMGKVDIDYEDEMLEP